MKYPIGIQSFDQLIKEEFIYVDKTDMIYSLATEGKIYFLSRPRRFGKSLLISTIEAYFKGKSELFKGLKIDSLESEWLEYPVFHMDFNGIDYNEENALKRRLIDFISGWEMEYNVSLNEDSAIGVRFEKVLEAAYNKYGRGAVVLIDEYDKPLLDLLERNGDILDKNRETLKAFYSVFKLADRYLKFVFLTGVTKFSQVSVFSGFNQPFDISMSAKYDALCGITEDELYFYFEDSINDMATNLGYSMSEMKRILKSKYDGYHFSEGMTDVYNPFSMLNAFRNNAVRDYWFSSGTPEYLIRLLSEYGNGIDKLTGKYYNPSEFVDYRATNAYPLPMIYQSGYFTIKDYDRRRERFMLDFPNNEVKSGFLTLLASSYFKTDTDTRNVAQDMAFSLEDGKLDDFMDLLTAFLADIPYTMRRKSDEREKERYFHYTFYLILRLMSTYIVFIEKVQSCGRVDCIIETDKYVYIFEFKLDGSVSDALNQIEDKNYSVPYINDKRSVFKIGVNFSSETGTVEDWKVIGNI